MSKNLKQNVIKEIKSSKVAMRPRWIFVLGSALSGVGLFISGMMTLLSIQLIKFRFLRPGIGASYKLDYLLSSIPWYLPVIAVGSLISGYMILRRYDFSYRKNIYFILSIIVAGLVFGSILWHMLNVDQFMSRRGYFRQIYQEQQEYPSTTPGRRMRRGSY
jgi:hypothetical protein